MIKEEIKLLDKYFGKNEKRYNKNLINLEKMCFNFLNISYSQYANTEVYFEENEDINTILDFEMVDLGYYSTLGYPKKCGKIVVTLNNLYKKYKNKEDFDIVMTLREEIVKEIYKDFKKLKCPEGHNKKLWNIACELEASSFYDFTCLLRPRDISLPEKLSAESYYNILKKQTKDSSSDNFEFSNNLKPSDDSESSNKSNSSDKNKKENKSENKENNQRNEDTKQTEKENNEESLKKDEENNFNEESSKKSDKENDYIQKLLNNINDDFAKDFIELESFSNSQGIGSHFRNIPDVEDKIEENSIFKEIQKFINSRESEYKIVKTKKEKTYFKYSWKTDDRNNGILYRGNLRVKNGVSKKFMESPVIFFDFSGSTNPINKDLNSLMYSFYKNGYTCCTYDNELTSIIEPNDIFCRIKSGGGTNSLYSVEKYFKLTERNYNKNFNIYIITDGKENYNPIFEKFPNTVIFKIKNKNDYEKITSKNYSSKL